MAEQLAPVQRRLERECELHMKNGFITKIQSGKGEVKQDIDSKAAAKSDSKSSSTVYGDVVMEKKNINIAIPEVPRP